MKRHDDDLVDWWNALSQPERVRISVMLGLIPTQALATEDAAKLDLTRTFMARDTPAKRPH